MARFGYSIVLPAMQVDLGMDNTEAGVLAATHVVGYLIASLLGGMLAARFGPRRVIALGLGLAGVGRVLAEGWQMVSRMRAFHHRPNSAAVSGGCLESGLVEVGLLSGLVA